MWSLVFIILLAILVVITVFRFKSRRKRKLASRIPGPDGYPIIGILPTLLKGPEKMIEESLKMYRM